MLTREKRSARPPAGSSASKNVAMGNGDGAQSTARDPFTQPDRLLAEWLATVLLEICEAHWRNLGEAEQDVHASSWWGGRAT